MRPARIAQLLNLFLQLVGGLATYHGMFAGVREGNPLLQACLDYYGVLPALVGAKATASLLLMYLYCVAYISVSYWGLVLTASIYFVFSFLPWASLWLQS